MKLKRICYLMIFFIGLVVLLINNIDSGNSALLFKTNTCRPPCWIGISPNETKFEKAIEILENEELNSKGRFDLLSSDIIRWKSNDGNNSYFYKNDAGLVSKIDVDTRSSSTHLKDIIEFFGAPIKLDIGKVRDGFFTMTIFYPEAGLAFVVTGNKFHHSQGQIGFAIREDMVVVKGLFFKGMDISSVVHLLYQEEAFIEALSDIQDWRGYEIYYEE